MTRAFVAAVFALALLLQPRGAAACSTCACGDYTITLMGAEKPYAGRLRAAADFAMRSETKGAAGQLDFQDIDEWRTNLGLSYSPSPRLTIGAQVPLVKKRVRFGNLAEIETEGVGDADLLLRWAAWQDRATMPRHMAGLRAGVRLPTSEEVKDGNGNRIDIDAQPDPGATAPNLGGWYGYYRFPLFVTASAYYLKYGEGNQDFEPGDALIASVSGQYALGESFAIQLGLDGRHTQRNRFSGVEDPNSGGVLTMGFAGAVLRFGADFLVHAGIQFPLHEDLNGVQEEERSYRIGLAYDF